MTIERAVRQRGSRWIRVYGAIPTKRVNAVWSPTSGAITWRPKCAAASALAIAASVGSSDSATSRAASAVVAVAMQRAPIVWTRSRHWSNATGFERSVATSESWIGERATRQWTIGSVTSDTIESGAS